jgi:arylsulfatase A-like enzyme
MQPLAKLNKIFIAHLRLSIYRGDLIMKRRQFMKLSVPAAISLGMGGTGLLHPREARAGVRPARTRPNILFIMTDQQSAGTLGAQNGDGPNTPAMDSLLHGGVSFERAYCSDPICVPSRTSWITGLMPHQTGVTFNTYEPGVEARPISPLLKEAGYDTGYVGKWHIPHDPLDHDWHGFDYVAHARSNRLDDDVPVACAEFLSHQVGDRPFFLVASFVNPHDICQWARQASGIDDPFPNGPIPDVPAPQACPPLPANFAIPENEPSVIREHQLKIPRAYPSRNWGPDTWRQYRWAYYRLIEKVDAKIGLVLDALRQTGLWENTVIVFTSDHGDGQGAHHWNQKTLFYDEVSRVPLIVCDPRNAHGRIRRQNALVNMNLDLFPTLFDYAGIPCPASLPGISLKPLAEAQTEAKSHPFVISQTDLHPEFGRSDGIVGRMVRTPGFKYICFSEGQHPEQLFDMEADPGELHSLAETPVNRPTLLQHRRLLQDWIDQNGDSFTFPSSLIDISA